jgi:hypothetical protein
MDPALKPYVLEFSGQEVSSVYTAIGNIVNSIDKMANTGSIRGNEARVMSGISREVEFALLNSRLSEMADNTELAEEQMWQFYARYQGTTWDGEIEYPDSFSIHDTDNELEQKLNVYRTIDDPAVKAAIRNDIVDLLDLEVIEDVQEEMPVSTGVSPAEINMLLPDSSLDTSID